MIEGKLLNLVPCLAQWGILISLSYDNGGGKGGMHTKAPDTVTFANSLCTGGVKGQTWPRAEASSSGSPQGCDQVQTVLFD